jgi:PAS domain S-box-containing protein
VSEPEATREGAEEREGGSGGAAPASVLEGRPRVHARRDGDVVSAEVDAAVGDLRGEAAMAVVLERLEPVFRHSPVGVVALALDGRILRANSALGVMLGRPAGDLEGTSWHQFFTEPGQLARVERRIVEALQRGELSFDVYGPIAHAGGQQSWVLGNFSVATDGAGTAVGLVATVHDITYPVGREASRGISRGELDLRRAIAVAANEAEVVEDAMTIALERLCTYLDWPVGHVYLTTTDGMLMSTGMWHFTDQRHGAIRESLRFGTFNPRRSPPGAVLASHQAVWMPDSAAEEGFTAADTARERGLSGWAGFPITSRTECVGVIEFYAVLPPELDPGLRAMMSDIGAQLGRVMERRRAEDDRTEILIREQFLTAWFRSLLQSTEEGICGLDLDGRVTFVNRTGAQLLGHTPEAMQGSSFHELSHHTRADGTAYPAEVCPILQASRSGAGVRINDEVFWRRDGTPFSVEYSSHAIVDLGGDIKGTVLTFIDITERRREEQAVRALNEALLTTKEELERANMLKSDFLATMSHELRTPLNAIMGFAGLMRNGLAGEVTETGADYLERISRNAALLLALINDVLDLSKIEANRMPLSPRVIELAPLVRQAVENMQSLADTKGLQLELQDFSSDSTVIAHQRAVGQVLTNLLSNAIKFTETGSVTVQVKNAGSRLLVEVIDTGTGIAADEQALVFEAFRQVGAHARTGTGGTGLGLAISKRLARELGGDLTVQSDIGVGSHFTLELLAARVSPGLVQDSGPAPVPVVLWATADFGTTQRIREWVSALDLGFVGIGSTELLTKAALEMRPAVIALDLPVEVIGDVVARVREEAKLAAVPLLLVCAEEVRAAEAHGAVWQLRPPFGRDQLHAALASLRRPHEPRGGSA